ncbi:GDSL esterase/lipase APG-like [Pistacia vera]|uniref:GDSL esterase/lipase APG-like n=1 Tax=Pistacia vera TaxID=55513 RepID=UPI001262FDEA|nr:GDSL esterase/lipase APG-like [Pistacia vera]
MDLSCKRLLFLVILAFTLSSKGYSQPLAPASITFGNSAVDVGNNNYIPTLFKANYPPYGKDFVNHQPTGRFCNGKLVTGFTADTLQFTNYALPYLSPQASGKNLLIGANFASAGASYEDQTSSINHAIPLSKQLQYYKEYQSKLAKVSGTKQSASIIQDAIYVLGAGSGDFLQNYYVNPILNKAYTPQQYSSILVSTFSSFIKVPSQLKML